MRLEKQITNNKFLNIKEVKDTSLKCNGYQFAERLGIDSIAFICYDREKESFLLNNEVTPPIGKFLIRAFGGSLDNPEMSKKEIVQREVEEEVGYTVKEDDIKFLGECFVSTQMNQYCYLYIVFIDQNKYHERKPENEMEALSHPVWKTFDEIMDGDDWKSITILQKSIHKKVI